MIGAASCSRSTRKAASLTLGSSAFNKATSNGSQWAAVVMAVAGNPETYAKTIGLTMPEPNDCRGEKNKKLQGTAI
jgi:hypothetical protein